MAFDASADKSPKIGRRAFLTWSAGGAFMLAVNAPATAQAPAAQDARPQSPWFSIGKDERLMVYSTAVEMGQGSHTGHAAIVAHELDVPWDRVDVQMVDVQQYANQVFTGGSRSISGAYANARKAGATARAQFMQAAARQWNVTADDVEIEGGKVVNKATKATLSYGELAVAAAAVPAPQKVAYREGPTNACIGQEMPTKRVAERVTGAEVYGIDVRLPNLQRASIRAAPVFGAKLVSVDEAPALAIPGVTKVIKLDDAVAVVAKDTWTAMKGVQALQPQWSTPAQRASSAEVNKMLAGQAAAKLAEPPSAAAAPLRAAYDAAARKVEQTYALDHISHATMEPQNATVHVTADKVEVWAPTQVPTSVKRGAGAWAGKPNAEVVLHTTMLGGGFGRRLATDYVEQAVKIAAQVDGPVQLVWSREEDFTHDTYRRATRQTYRAGLRADGLIDAYEVIAVAADSNVARGMEAAPYSVLKPAIVTQAGNVKTGIPQGPWRSVDEGISTWGRESFISECATAAGRDPFEYRMALLGDNARAKRLLQAVADKIDWRKKRPAGTGVGIALGAGFGSLAAHAVEVKVSKDNRVTVIRIVAAGDIGTVIAPNQVRAQFEGGTLMALGTALSEGMTYTDGKANEQNFDSYQILRGSQAPAVEVILLETADAPVGGSGEPPVPTLAPALAGAIFQASGKRVRSLPIKNQGFKV